MISSGKCLNKKLNSEEWDLTNLVVSVRNLKLMMKMLLQEHQILLMSYDKTNNLDFIKRKDKLHSKEQR